MNHPRPWWQPSRTERDRIPHPPETCPESATARWWMIHPRERCHARRPRAAQFGVERPSRSCSNCTTLAANAEIMGRSLPRCAARLRTTARTRSSCSEPATRARTTRSFTVELPLLRPERRSSEARGYERAEGAGGSIAGASIRARERPTIAAAASTRRTTSSRTVMRRSSRRASTTHARVGCRRPFRPAC